MRILTINGGSSSIKFALYEMEGQATEPMTGALRPIFRDEIDKADDHEDVVRTLEERLQKQGGLDSIDAIGHRIVFGMQHGQAELITPCLIDELKKVIAFDPEHLPGEIKWIETFAKRLPGRTQIACFDTSFHASMPPIAKMLSIPRRYYNMGIQRYGFHGLSYSFLLGELRRIAGNETANGRLILAHLGSGASLAAVKEGRSLDTSMGFTPASGLPMGTRTGDLDPGVAWWLMKDQRLSAEQFNRLINHESGLLGISEMSSDMRELILVQGRDSRAREAVQLFCYQAKKWIGSFAAVLGGVDSLIFSGGIGENAPEIRDRICRGLQFLGIELDPERNICNEGIITTDASRVCVRVIRTNEELMIAHSVCDVLTHIIKN